MTARLAAAMLLAAAPLALGFAPPADDDAVAAPRFVETVLAVTTSAGTRLALVDADGDGRTDLLTVGPAGLRLRRMRPDGRYPTEPDWQLVWPAEKLGWDLGDIDGDGADEVVMLLDGTTVRAWKPGIDDGDRVLLENVGGFLPRGIRRMRFVRDVDGDGIQDAVIPGAGRFLIHRGVDGGLDPDPLTVTYEADIEVRVGDPDSLDGRFGQEVAIPLFGMRDIDGDGRNDLVSQSDDELAVHLGAPALSARPSWRLDLAALREEIDRPDSIDLEDLFANIPPTVRWQTADIDGVPPHDMVLQRGSRFTLHLGGTGAGSDGRPGGPDLAAPDQVLKASGNVMHFLLRDVDGDGRVDLQLLRAETISLGTVLRWLVISGSLDFDVFTYPNEGSSFARKPASRKTLSLRVPAILGFIEDIEGMEDGLESMLRWPARPLCLDGDGRSDDIVDVDGGLLVITPDAVPADWDPGLEELVKSEGLDGLIEAAGFSSLDRVEDGGTLEIDLGQLDRLVPTPGWDLHLAAQGRRPRARRLGGDAAGARPRRRRLVGPAGGQRPPRRATAPAGAGAAR